MLGRWYLLFIHAIAILIDLLSFETVQLLFNRPRFSLLAAPSKKS